MKTDLFEYPLLKAKENGLHFEKLGNRINILLPLLKNHSVKEEIKQFELQMQNFQKQ